MIIRYSQWVTAFLLLVVAAPTLAIAEDAVTDLVEARRIFVPLEDLDVVLERDKQGVLLHRDKFNALIAKARAEKNPAPVGVSVVVSNADYVARIVGDQLLLAVTAELTQFEADWRETRFGLQRLSVEQALLDDAPALLGRHADGSVSLFTSVRGKHTLKLQLSTELNAVGSDQVAAFSLLPVASGTLSLSLLAGKRLVIGNTLLERPAPLEQPADYRVAVGGSGAIQLRITDRATENAADSLMFASTGYGLNVAPGEVTWHALTTLQVFGKPVSRLNVTVPASLEIADVDATGLEAWTLSDSPSVPQQKVISLTFGQAFDGIRKISFKGVMATTTGQAWSVPPLKIENVTSQIGQVIVQHAAGVRLRVEEATGVRRATHEAKPTADMPDDLPKVGLSEYLRFDVWQPDFTLRISAQPKQGEIQAAVAAVLDVNVTGLELQAAVTVQTHFAPLFEVDIRLPSEWQVLTVQRENQPLPWHMVELDEVGVAQLRVVLDQPLAADAKAQIRLSLRRDVEGWPVEVEPITVNLPELYLPQSNLTEGAFVVRGDDDLNLESIDLKGLDPQPLKADFERMRFQTQDTRYAGKLKITRKPARVSVQTVIFGRLDPQTFHTFLQAVVDVQGGGVRSIKVVLPESVGTAIRFESPNSKIVEQNPSTPANGERVWTLQFDQRLRGQALILCDLDVPRGDAKEFILPQPRFVDAERQNAYLAIEASGEQRLTVKANAADGQELAEVDPLDLPPVFYQPKERIVAVHQAFAPGAVVSLTEQKFERLPVATAICPLLEVSTILGRTGELQHRATFHLNVVGVQGLHVTFSPGSTLWSTSVDGRPVEVRRNGDVYLIPLTAGILPGESRTLQLFYRSEVATVAQSGTLTQTPPSLTVESGQRTALPVEILKQTWELSYPDQTRLINSHGPMEQQQPFDSTSSFANWFSHLSKPRPIHFGRKLLGILLAIGIVAFLASGLHRSRKFVGTILVLLLFVALTQIAPAVQNARRSAKISESNVAANRSRMQGMQSDIEIERRSTDGEKQIAEESVQLRLNENLAARDAAKPVKAAAPVIPTENSKRSTLLSRNIAEKKDALPAFDKNKHHPVHVQNGVDGLGRMGGGMGGGMLAADAVAQNEETLDDLGEGKSRHAERDGKESAAGTGLKHPTEGLLSVAIDFVPPAGSRQMTFQYVGAETAPTGIPLEVDYVDQQAGMAMRLFMMALVTTMGWFLRNQNITAKIGLATIGIVAVLAFAPFASSAWQMVLAGVFWGTWIAVGIWLVSWCAVHWCCCCCGPRLVQKSATAMLLAILWVLPAATFAAEGRPMAPTPSAPQTKPEPTIIIPFDAGTEPLASDRVFLAHEQFIELYRAANPDLVAGQPAGQSGGIVEALYAASLVRNATEPADAVIRFAARYAVRSFGEQQSLVELPVGQVAASVVKLDGKTAPLIAAAGRFKVAVKNPGLHVIDFSFDVPARLSGTTGTFSLSLMAVPAGKLTFRLPANDLSVRVNGSATIFRRTTQGDVQSLELPIDKGGDLVIAWQPQQIQNAVAAVVQVDSVSSLTLTDAGGAVSNGFAFNVRQGGIAETSFSLPSTLRLQSINGADVGGWEVKGEGDARILRVLFRRNVTDSTRLTVDAFLDVNIGSAPSVISIPQLVPKEVTNEIGQVAIFADSQFSIRADQVESLTQIDGGKFATTLPVSRPNIAPQLAYRFSKRPYSLSVQVVRQESQAHVVAQQAAFITLRKVQTTTRLTYNLTGVPRSVFSLTLPANFVLLDVQATGLKDWYVAKQDDGSLLTIEINAPRLGLSEVVIGGFIPRDRDAVSVKFPQPLDATRIDSTAAIWLDGGFSATLESFAGWRSVDSSQVNPQLQAVRKRQPPQFVFTSTSALPAALELVLKQATPKLSALSLSMVTVTDTAVVYTLALQWQIDAAKTDVLTLTTPNWLAGKLEFQGPGLSEVTQVDVAGDRTRWTLRLRTPQSGKYFATATAALPPAAGDVRAPAIAFEHLQQRLEAQQQYVLLINSSMSQLTTTDASITESVQREDVPIVIQQEFVDQATELVRVKTVLGEPKWSLHKFAQQPGVPASVNIADFSTVLSRDGTYRAQANFIIKNRSRQFLALKMPDETELLSVFVAGQPSRAVAAKLSSLNGATAQLIALPQTTAVDLSFSIKVVWRGRLRGQLPGPAQLLREEFSVPAPKILSTQEDADFGIPVARTRWTVYLPEDFDATAVRSVAKHNLSLSGDSSQLYGEAALQEAGDLMGVIEQIIDTNRRSQRRGNVARMEIATSNLKQLGLALNQLGDPNDAEYGRKKAEIQARTTEIEKLAQDEIRKTTDFFSNSTQTAPEGEQNSLPKLGLVEGQAIADDQQTVFIQGNSAVEGLMETSPDESNFNFPLIVKDSPAAGTTDSATEKMQNKSGSKATSSGVELRQQLQEENGLNIDGLNTTVSNNAASRNANRLQRQNESADGVQGNTTVRGLINQPGLWLARDHSSVEQTAPPASGGVTNGLHSDADQFWGLDLPGQLGKPFNPAPSAGEVQFSAPYAYYAKSEGRLGRQGAARGDALPEVRRQVGGLSLEIDLPTTGQKLVFTKTGGDPKLTLAIRSRKSLGHGVNLAWSAVWLVIGIIILATLRKPAGLKRLLQQSPRAAVALGILGFFIFPGPLSFASFLLFAVGAYLVARQFHAPTPVA